jgi:hypothetical protein
MCLFDRDMCHFSIICAVFNFKEPFEPEPSFSPLKRAPLVNIGALLLENHQKKNGYVPFLVFMCRFKNICAILAGICAIF